MTDRVLEVPGAALDHDVQEGDPGRPVVVALHGLTSSRAAEDATGYFGWSAVAAGGRTLVRYDARGHGRSTGRAEPADWAWTALADDLLALLDAVSPGAPVDAIGVSMGVGTILTAAVRAPGRFRRLALVIPPTAWGTRAAQAEMYGASARFVEERGLAAFVRGAAAMPVLPILTEGGWEPTPPDVAEALLPTVLRGAATADLPAPEDVAALRHETLLLPWTDDPGHPVSTSQRLAELLPHAELEVTTSAEQLRAVGARVAAFLG